MGFSYLIAIIVQHSSCVVLTLRGRYDIEDLLSVMCYSDSSEHKYVHLSNGLIQSFEIRYMFRV